MDDEFPSTDDTESRRELRCVRCRALLAYEHIVAGRLEIRCPRGNCRLINSFTFRGAKKELLRYQYDPDKIIRKEVSNAHGSRH